MKKILVALIILNAFPSNCFLQCQCTGSSLYENYSTNIAMWVKDNNGTPGCLGTANGDMTYNNLGNGFLSFESVTGGRQNRIYRGISTLSNINWTSDFEFKIVAPSSGCKPSNEPEHMLAGFSAGTLPLNFTSCSGGNSCSPCATYSATGTDMIWVELESANGSTTNTNLWYFRPYSRDGSSAPLTSTSVIYLPTNATGMNFYLRLQRINSTQGLLSVCFDNQYLNHLPGSPLCFPISSTVTNLNVLQHGAIPQALCSKVLNANIDNMKIANSLECGLTLTPSFTAPSYICDGGTITVDGTATVGSPWQETEYTWEIIQYNALGNPTGNSWSHQYNGQAGIYTFPSASAGGPTFITCGKGYYMIKLTVSNCGTNPVSVTKIVSVKCNPVLIIDGETEICQGESTTLTASGASTYFWTPMIDFSNPITLTPNVTTTYGLAGYDTYGCSSTTTVAVNVLPSIDISTGRNNSTGGNLAWGQADDTWKLRGVPGWYDYSAFNVLGWANVLQPYPSYCSSWNWIGHAMNTSNPNIGLYMPINEPATLSHTFITSPGTLYDYYWYEMQFNIDPNALAQYGPQMVLEIEQIAADNAIDFFLNGHEFYINNILSTTSSDPWQNYSNCQTNPPVVGFSSNWLQAGNNILQVRLRNGSNTSSNPTFQAFMLKGRITACGQNRNLNLSASNSNQNFESRINAFPNPNLGDFTLEISSESVRTANLYIMDISGRLLSTQIINLTQGLNKIFLWESGLPTGVYLIKVDGVGELVKIAVTK